MCLSFSLFLFDVQYIPEMEKIKTWKNVRSRVLCSDLTPIVLMHVESSAESSDVTWLQCKEFEGQLASDRKRKTCTANLSA